MGEGWSFPPKHLQRYNSGWHAQVLWHNNICLSFWCTLVTLLILFGWNICFHAPWGEKEAWGLYSDRIMKVKQLLYLDGAWASVRSSSTIWEWFCRATCFRLILGCQSVAEIAFVIFGNSFSNAFWWSKVLQLKAFCFSIYWESKMFLMSVPRSLAVRPRLSSWKGAGASCPPCRFAERLW